MPFYKLICRDCGETFEKRASMKERSEKRISCPSCGSISLEADYTAGAAGFYIKQAGGDGCPHSAACGCGCSGSNGRSCSGDGGNG